MFSLENYNELEAIKLEAGDVLIFHALLIHAGCAYSKTNRRLHLGNEA
jgi:ectoine hydroxylase-related dioxygenase (phytanoyl-CoA dioxygenase family)